jgi:hypothetical protein
VRIDGELNGHTVAQSIAFVAELQDVADEQQSRQRALPAGVISPDLEPRRLTTVRRWFGR